MLVFFVVKLVFVLLPLLAIAANEDAPTLFAQHCQTCHQDGHATRAPLPDALKSKAPKDILVALENGTMKAQAAQLSNEQRLLLANFLGSVDAGKVAMTGFCAAVTQARTDSTFWNGWGVDAKNSRFQSADQAKLGLADLPKLKLKWAFGFPQSNSSFGQPSLVGGKLYFGSENGTIYSVNAKTGCIYWTFKAPTVVRTAITIAGTTHNRYVAYFGDTQANVYALDAETGKQLWKTKVDDHRLARITGAPKLYEDRLYVPVSSTEEVSPANAKYECCTFRGSVVALDLETGKVAWKTYMIPDEPKPGKKNSAGTQLFGPSGAAVWMTPAIDTKRKALYVGTGNGYSDPDTAYSDSIQALDLKTGKRLWVKQTTKGDGWNFACVNPNKASCPEVSGPDVDFGAPPILVRTLEGKDLVVVGQKSGVVHALDPDADGAIQWQTRIGKGGSLGGIQWGMAADTAHVYAALSDRTPGKPELEGGLFALSLANGGKIWSTPAPQPDCTGVPNCSAAQMSPVSVVPGVVFSGSMDGHLRAYESAAGKIVWDFNTKREFETVNGVKAKGGSVGGGSGPVIAAGMLFMTSGYGALAGMPGNVLLAFGLD